MPEELAAPWKVPLYSQAIEPPGLLMREHAALQMTNEALALENARLANEMMVLQNARLAQENLFLRMQSQSWHTLGPCMNQWGMITPKDVSPTGCSEKKPSKKCSKLRESLGKRISADDSVSLASSFGNESTSAGSNSFGSTIGDDMITEPKSNSALATTPAHMLTTVMMRNIPNNYTRAMLLDLIDSEGFKGQYNLVYLPIDFKNHVGLGYSFINLLDSEIAKSFQERFSGFQQWTAQSDKVCEVTWSDALQGIGAHIERYRNSPVMHESVPDECKPALFKAGKRVSFPEPTKRIRAPRQWPRRH